MVKALAVALFVTAAGLGAISFVASAEPPPARFGALACQLQIDDARQASKRARYGDTRGVLIGDSWATGDGVFPDELAKRLRLDLRIAAVGGTGYVNPGGCGGREFLSRAWEVPQDAELVVLAGGVNDAHTDPDILAAAVRDVIAAVHSRAPGARIVVLGVPRVLLLDDEATADVDGVLLEVAGDAFITVRGWDISMSPDRIHPDDAGARAYAAEIAAVVEDHAPLAPS